MFLNRLKSRFDGFYGWIIVLASFIIMVVGVGIVYNSASLFIKPISEDLGFSRQETAMIITIRNICTMIISILFGRIVDKFDLKKIMKISIVIMCISYFSYSFVNTLVSLYIVTLIVSTAFSLIGLLPLAIIIDNWFYENAATAMGVAFMGSGIGGMIFNSLTGQLIMSYGWRSTHQILAIIMFVTMVPAIFFMIYIHPKDKNTIAYGYIEESIESQSYLTAGISTNQAIRKFKFWLLLGVIILHSMGITGVLYNTAPHLSDEGYSIGFSANIVALTMGSLAVGKIVLGKLYDNLGIKKSTIIASLAVIAGLFGLIYPANYIGIFLIIVGGGLGAAFNSIGIPIIAKGVFGEKDYASIYGILSAAKSLGGVLTPWLSGYTYDITGSYDPFFKIALIGIFIIIIVYGFIFKNYNIRKQTT